VLGQVSEDVLADQLGLVRHIKSTPDVSCLPSNRPGHGR
jgi:hypothetical protein